MEDIHEVMQTLRLKLLLLGYKIKH